MSNTVRLEDVAADNDDWAALMRRLGPAFAARADHADETDSFVAANYAELKRHRVFAAAVPAELGGGDATLAELSEMLRVLATYCSSTALAVSMHTHVVAVAAWRWRRDKAPLEPLLRRVAAEQIVLVSTGGGDWLKSVGRAEKVEGGFRIYARKAFASGAPAGDILNTSAVYDDPAAGPTVLHFGVSLRAEGVRIEETWQALGMRGTGSNDVVLDGAFVADAAIAGRRPQGKWHRLFHIISMVALPLIYSAYVGVAEAACERALALVAARRDDSDTQLLAGEMHNELAMARMALADMIANAASLEPGPAATSRALTGRTLAGQAAIRTVEKAMALAGGAAMYRARGLERLFRDVQGARFHPVQEKAQQRLSGRVALGVDIDG
jgi:acyl-CoA dehydrogenase